MRALRWALILSGTIVLSRGLYGPPSRMNPNDGAISDFPHPGVPAFVFCLFSGSGSPGLLPLFRKEIDDPMPVWK